MPQSGDRVGEEEPAWRAPQRVRNIRRRVASITTRDLCAEIARRHPRSDVGFACARAVKFDPPGLRQTGSEVDARSGSSLRSNRPVIDMERWGPFADVDPAVFVDADTPDSGRQP